MKADKIVTSFRLTKRDFSSSQQYGGIYLQIFAAKDDGYSDTSGANTIIEWMSSRDSPNYGWFGMRLNIEMKNNYRFADLMQRFVAPLIKKMQAADLLGSSTKPNEVCSFLESQKIPQIVYYRDTFFLLKDIRSNNLYEVKQLGTTYNPYVLIADSELDAKYRVKKKFGSSPFNMDDFSSRRLDMSEYEHLFKESWRSVVGDIDKKEQD